MTSREVMDRFAVIAASAGDLRHLPLQVRHVGASILVEGSARAALRTRLQVRVVGGAIAILGLALTPEFPAAVALAVGGVGLLASAPRWGKVRRLLELDLDAHLLRLAEHSAAPGTEVPLAEITAVEGRYETSGWEGHSLVSATNTRNESSLLVVLPGTDEQGAAFFCRAIAAILDVPGSYVGPFGATHSWARGGVPAPEPTATQVPTRVG